MKEIYRNPILYYILIPVTAALWPLLVWTMYLPDVEDNLQEEMKQYIAAEEVMGRILDIDPGRLDFAGSKRAAAEFDYAIAVDEIASQCKIPAVNYKLNAANVIKIKKSGGQKSQIANVGLDHVDITKFANFLSTIQLRWANLQCEMVKLTKQKGAADEWKIDIKLKYYY